MQTAGGYLLQLHMQRILGRQLLFRLNSTYRLWTLTMKATNQPTCLQVDLTTFRENSMVLCTARMSRSTELVRLASRTVSAPICPQRISVILAKRNILMCLVRSEERRVGKEQR